MNSAANMQLSLVTLSQVAGCSLCPEAEASCKTVTIGGGQNEQARMGGLFQVSLTLGRAETWQRAPEAAGSEPHLVRAPASDMQGTHSSVKVMQAWSVPEGCAPPATLAI